MPRKVDLVGALQEYVRGVIAKAEHHAKRVDEIALAVAGAVLWRNDDDEIEVMEHKGKMANVLWLRVNGRRYALSLNHITGEIDVREKTTHGKTLASFNNTNSVADVKTFFASL